MKLKPNDPNKKRWHHLNLLNDFQQHCKDIDVYDVRILLCLFRHGNSKAQASVGVRRGARECGIAPSTWEARVKKMKTMGLLNYGVADNHWRRRYFVSYSKMEDLICQTVPPQTTNRTVPDSKPYRPTVPLHNT